MRTCRDCGETKPTTEFYHDGGNYTSDCKLCHKAKVLSYRYRKRTEVLNFLGGQCVACGESDRRVLQINHLDGGGKETQRNPMEFVRSILEGRRSVDDLEVRCANCNIRYEYERGNRVQWDVQG